MILVPPITINEAVLSASSVADDTVYSAVTSYTLGARVRVGDAPAVKVYECVQAPALDKYPPSNPLHWKLVGSSARWAMFDDSVQTATSSASTLTFTITPPRRVTSIWLMGLVGSAITLTVRSSAGGAVLFTETRTLRVSAGTYYSWAFDEMGQASEAYWYGLPTTLGATFEVSITPANGVAACGLCKVGREQWIGDAEFGAEVGTEQRGKDFLDAQQNPVASDRGFSRSLTATLHIPLTEFNRVNRLFEAQVQQPAIWVVAPGLGDYDTAVLYGRFQRVVRVLSGPTHVVVSLEVAGFR